MSFAGNGKAGTRGWGFSEEWLIFNSWLVGGRVIGKSGWDFMKTLPLLVPLVCGWSFATAAPADSFELFWADAQKEKRAEKSESSQRRLDWWRDARFGMFIHWDISSVAACEISWSKEFYDDGTGDEAKPNPRPSAGPAGGPRAKEVDNWHKWMTPPVPKDIYDQLHKSFFPGMFDADRIVAQAKEAGMKYIVQIAKHHGGFCMWDSEFSEYDMMATPFRRDIIAEMAKACEKAGMKYGIYYSQRDWHHPDYGPERMPQYNAFMRNQLRELLTRHSNIAMVWFDSGGYPHELWETETMFRMIHEIRPDILINNRSGVPADFTTPEQRIGDFNADRDWESCMTFTGNWSWHGFEKPVISYEACLRNLVFCAGGNGNLLMNIGPMPTGEIDPREADRLKRVGEWLRTNGEAIYGSTGGPFLPHESVVSTRKGNAVYLHVLQWKNDRVMLPALPVKIISASLMAGGKVEMSEQDGSLAFQVAAADQQVGATVIKLEIEGDAAALPLIRLPH